MPSCTNCGSPLPPGTKYCPRCGTPVTASPPSTPYQPAPTPAAGFSERPFTKAEGSTLATMGAGPRSLAGSLGFVNILMGAFAFAESPQTLGGDGATFLTVLTFGMGMLALAAGASSRRSRALAKEALSAGRVVEAHGTVGSPTMQANRILLTSGVLEVPKAGRAGAQQGFVGTGVGPEGSSVDAVFTRPKNPGVANVVLLSLNGGALPKAVKCRFVGGGG